MNARYIIYLTSTPEDAANRAQLLVLVQGRCLTGEDYERLVTVFPGSLRIPLSPNLS